jgi:hypothetical protein
LYPLFSGNAVPYDVIERGGSGSETCSGKTLRPNVLGQQLMFQITGVVKGTMMQDDQIRLRVCWIIWVLGRRSSTVMCELIPYE